MLMQIASSRSLKLSKVSGGLRQMVNGAFSNRSNARSAGRFERSDNPIAPETRTQAPTRQTTLKWDRASALIVDEALSRNRPTPDPSQEGNSASVPDIDSPPPEGLGVGSWLRFTSGFWRCSLPMNLVAADVRRLRSISDFGFRISDFEKRASSRRLLLFKGSMREIFRANPSPADGEREGRWGLRRP